MSFGIRRGSLVLVSFVMLSTLVPLSANGTVTIRNIPPTPHLAPAGTSPTDLATAIKLGIDDQGWQVVAEAPGKIKARLKLRTHMALVAISFDETNYWIDYAGSSNLSYNKNDLVRFKRRKRSLSIKGPRIHKNYHIWVANLAQSIEIRMQQPAYAAAPNRIPISRSVLMSEEVRKLDALRQRGVISDEEFERQKALLRAR